MIVILDSNVILSGIAVPLGCPATIYRAWLRGDFHLVTCDEQLQEIRDSSRKPYFSQRVKPHAFGHIINGLRRAKVIANLPRRHKALDPSDSYLLDLASAASADYLVTGDKKSGLLQLGNLEGTRILSPTEFCTEVLKTKR